MKGVVMNSIVGNYSVKSNYQQPAFKGKPKAKDLKKSYQVLDELCFGQPLKNSCTKNTVPKENLMTRVMNYFKSLKVLPDKNTRMLDDVCMTRPQFALAEFEAKKIQANRNNVICDLAERNASIEEIEKSLTWIFPEQKQSLKTALSKEGLNLKDYVSVLAQQIKEGKEIFPITTSIKPFV